MKDIKDLIAVLSFLHKYLDLNEYISIDENLFFAFIMKCIFSYNSESVLIKSYDSTNIEF